MSKRSVPIRPFVLAILLLGLTISFAPPVRADDLGLSILGFRVVNPVGDLNKVYDTSFAFASGTEIEVNDRWDALIEVSWTRLNADISDADVFAFLVGPQLDLHPFRTGIKGGYYFGDFHEWDVVPYAQVTVWKFDFGVEAKALGSHAQWVSGYVGFRWRTL